MLRFQSKLRQLVQTSNCVVKRMNSAENAPEPTAANVNDDYIEDDNDMKIDVKTPTPAPQMTNFFKKETKNQQSQGRRKGAYGKSSIFDIVEEEDVRTMNPSFGIHDLEKRLKIVKRINSSSLFSRMLGNHPEILVEMKNHMSNQINYQSNPYKLVNDAFKRMTAEFSPAKIRDLEDGFKSPDGEISQALELLMSSGQIAVPNMNETQLFRLLVDPENLPALPYFISSKFNLAFKIDSKFVIEGLVEAMISFGPKRPELLNYLSLLDNSVKISQNKLTQLQQIIQSSENNRIVHASVLPFFLGQSAFPSNLYFNWFGNMISNLTVSFIDNKDIELWQKWVLESKSLIDQSELNGLQHALYDITTNCKTIEERSRAVILFLTIMQNASDAEAVNGLLSVFCLEFGSDLSSEIFLERKNPKLVNFLKRNGISNNQIDLKNGINSALSDNFLQKQEIVKLLNINTSFGFEGEFAKKLKFSIVSKRILQTQICKKTHGMTIGEFLALQEVKKVVPAVEFTSNTNFGEYSNLMKSDQFTTTYSYLNSTYEVNKDISNTSQNPLVSKEAIRGKFFKGQVARNLINKQPGMAIKRTFSTNNKADGNDEVNPLNEKNIEDIQEELELKTEEETAIADTAPESQTADVQQESAAGAEETNDSAQGQVGLNFNTNSHKATVELLNSDLTFEELKIQWAKLLEIASSNQNYKLMLFNSLFTLRDFELFIQTPEFEDFSSLKPSQKASLLLLKPPLIPKSQFVYNGKSRLGSMPLDLNKFAVIEELQINLQTQHLYKYLNNFQTNMTRTQYFILLNIHLSSSPKPSENFTDALIKACVVFRWPKTLIQTMHLLIQNNCISRANLQLGLESLARFRYMASEGIDIYISAIASNRAFVFSISMISPVLKSMFDCGQTQEVFQRFEDLKTAIQGVKYVEDTSLTVQKNEELEGLFKAKIEDVKREVYSMMFHFSIKYKINAQASMLYSEMISTKAFKTLEDAMNMLRYSRRSQMDLNATLEYIKTEMKYEENTNLVFPSQYATEWINVLTDGSAQLANNTQTILKLFFGTKNKTRPTRENLDAIIKFVLLNNNFKILSIFLDYMDKNRKSVNKEFGNDTLAVLLNTLSRCNNEETRNAIVAKLDRIFGKEDSARSKLLKESELKDKLQAQKELFDKVMESRLEKVHFPFYEFKNKEHPKARPNKDKRSFILKTMQETYLQEKAKIDAVAPVPPIPETEVSREKKARAQRIREAERQFAQESAQEKDFDDDKSLNDEPEKKKKEKMERADAPERGKSKGAKKPAANN